MSPIFIESHQLLGPAKKGMMKRLILIAISVFALSGCARFKEAVQNVPLGGRLTIPGITLTADNDIDGMDLTIDTSYEDPLLALKSIFWDLPFDVLQFFFKIGSITLDPEQDVTETPLAQNSAKSTSDFHLNRKMAPTMKLPAKTGDPNLSVQEKK